MSKIVLFLVLTIMTAICAAQTVSLSVTDTTGTTTAEIRRVPSSLLMQLTLFWTSTADGAAVAVLPLIVGEVLRVVTIPGTASGPTDNYDVTWTDQDGIDLLAGLGADRDETNAEQIVPLIGAGSITVVPPALFGTSTLNVSAAGNATTGTLRIYLRR